MNRRKLGQFFIHSDVVEHDPAVMAVMGHVIVVRCEHLYADNRFDYTALCEDFDVVSPGSEIPRYRVNIQQQESDICIEFEKA